MSGLWVCVGVSVPVLVYLCELWLMQIAGGLNQIYMIALGETARRRRKLIAANENCSELGQNSFQLLRLDDI